ncbi:hypothetical protein D3C79_910140 [compost metagenome]
MISLATRGARAQLPMPTRPVSVSTSTTSQPWKRNEPMASPRSNRMSLALVQKCAWGGTTLPFHSKTRVRIALIFMNTVPWAVGFLSLLVVCAEPFDGGARAFDGPTLASARGLRIITYAYPAITWGDSHTQ